MKYLIKYWNWKELIQGQNRKIVFSGPNNALIALNRISRILSFVANCRMILSFDAFSEAMQEKEKQTDKIAKMEEKQAKFELIIQSLIDSGQLEP